METECFKLYFGETWAPIYNFPPTIKFPKHVFLIHRDRGKTKVTVCRVVKRAPVVQDLLPVRHTWRRFLQEWCAIAVLGPTLIDMIDMFICVGILQKSRENLDFFLWSRSSHAKRPQEFGSELYFALCPSSSSTAPQQLLTAKGQS